MLVELYYDTYRNEVVRVQAIEGAGRLEDYAVYVQLPEGL